MVTIITLCDSCRKIYEGMYRVKMAPENTTTRKDKKCAHCQRALSQYELRQYILSKKGGKG